MRADPWERGLDVRPPEGAPEATDLAAEPGTTELPHLLDLPHLPDFAPLPDLPDLAELSLEELLDAPHPVLARAARRVLDRLAADEVPLAAYDSSAVPTDDTSV
ncbi:FxSxx-COOH cyclophane-containing RiPP peptide [Streptomyces sp. NPDC127166]|uniref:FxSxx-COOH cyclophane-containing RiPP peptide n=1 Tax=Streptomyces sp. NPDC127166 TaxID=3345380 RepID=UPI0036390435